MNILLKISLLLVSLLLFSCATGPSADSHYYSCMQKYTNFVEVAKCGKIARTQACNYWGNCSTMGNNLIAYADNLARGVKNGEVSNYEANMLFSQYMDQWNRNAYAAQQRQLQQSQALMSIGQSLMQSGTYGGTGTSSGSYRGGQTCFKQGEYTQGMNKVCQYSCTGSGHAITIGAAQLCPLTVKK